MHVAFAVVAVDAVDVDVVYVALAVATTQGQD